MACLHGLHTQEGDDVTGLCGVDFSAFISVHLDDAADALSLTGEGVEHARALRQLTGVDAGEGQCTVFVVHDLESKRTEWLAWIHDGEIAGFFTFSVHLGLRRDLSWAGQIVDDAVEHVLHALVLEGGTAVSGEEIEVDSALANALLEGFDIRLVPFEVGFHRFVVLLDGGFDEHGAVFFDFVDHIRRHFLLCVGHRVAGIIPDPGDPCQKVDHALEVTFGADGQHHDEWVGAENCLNLVDDLIEVSADAVELIDVNKTCDFRIIGITPVGFRLRLHTARTAENADTAVKHLQRAVDFDREVHVAGCVDDIEAVRLPLLLAAGPKAGSGS